MKTLVISKEYLNKVFKNIDQMCVNITHYTYDLSSFSQHKGKITNHSDKVNKDLFQFKNYLEKFLLLIQTLRKGKKSNEGNILIQQDKYDRFVLLLKDIEQRYCTIVREHSISLYIH